MIDLGFTIGNLLTLAAAAVGFIAWARTRVAVLERETAQLGRELESQRVALDGHEASFGHEPTRERLREIDASVHALSIRLATAEARAAEHGGKIETIEKVLSDLRGEVADVRERLVRIEALLERMLSEGRRS